MDDKSEQIKDVYANYGFTMYTAQCLEHELVNVFIYLDLISNHNSKINPKDWDNIFDEFTHKHFKSTLGRLIGHLEKVIEIDDILSDILSEALSLRNWLAHDYFKVKAKDFVSSEGREKMIKELQSVSEKINTADLLLQETYSDIKKKYGITEEVIQKISQDMLDQED